MGILGVIGGSGMYSASGLSEVVEHSIDTPFGKPSDAVMMGSLPGRDGERQKVAFLSRHGRGHRVPPHQINYRANIWAMKSLGVEWLLSISAVGSMKESIRPGDMVLVDQFIDKTSGRSSTFFENGIAAHVEFAEPISKELADIAFAAASDVATRGGVKAHRGGTYVVMNGPQFSTRAESLLHRSWGADVIGMTNMPEAKLAREAEISYATLALATDYDCWREGEDAVTVEAVMEVMKGNSKRAQEVLALVAKAIPANRRCPAKAALAHAIMTKTSEIPAQVKSDLSIIIGNYV